MNRAEISRMLRAGIERHQNGRLDEAETLYRNILAQEPRNPDAINLLGTIAHQVGKHEAAAELINEAILIDPDVSIYYNNLGCAYRDLKRWEEAVTAFQEAVRLQPDYHDAVNNHGLTLREEGRHEEAITYFRKALEMAPDAVGPRINLGNSLQSLGEIDEAMICYRKVLEQDNRNFEAWNNLAHSQLVSGESMEALKSSQRALSINVNHPVGLNNLGNIRIALGHWNKGRAAFEAALEQDPKYVEAYTNLGNILGDLRLDDKAIENYEKALELNPNFVKARQQMALVYQKQGRSSKAMAIYQQCLLEQPENSGHLNRIGQIYRDQRNLTKALESFEMGIKDDSKNSVLVQNKLFTYNYSTEFSRDMVFKVHCEWADNYAKPLYPADDARFQDPAARERLRIGYVSGDWKDHPVSYFTEGFLRNHDRNAFEVFCYSGAWLPHPRTDEFSKIPEHWTPTKTLKDEDLVETIMADGIDILVDLSGHTSYNRLLVFARRAAPVQVTYLGYPNTTGLRTMDYRLTDALSDPLKKADPYYTEKLYRLPDVAWCYTPHKKAPPVVPPPSLAGGKPVTFGCFSNYAKVRDDIIDLWVLLLKKIPNSKFFLKAKALIDETQQKEMLSIFEKKGISKDRVRVSGWLSKPEGHLALYNEIDIALDTFPYNGTTTTCEALYMGVPMVTMTGQTHCSRVGVSLLTTVGLADSCIARTPREYVKKAMRLASDTDALAEIRRTLRPRMEHSPLMDVESFTRNLEDAYRDMWNRWTGK